MKLLKNIKIAVLITAVIVILTMMAGVGTSLDRLARDVEATFFSERYVDAAGITRRGIYHHLENASESAFSLAMMMTANPELTAQSQALLAARAELVTAMNDRDISKMGEKYEIVRVRFFELTGRAEGLALSQRESDALSLFTRDFRGAMTAIGEIGYNDAVSSFMDNASVFAHLLKPFVFVTPPQPF